MPDQSKTSYSALDVAKWMFDQVNTGKYFYQEAAVYQIRGQFGEKFTYRNESGNFAIGKDVLREFRKLSEDNVIWERGERAWRLRRKHDREGRQQD